MCSHTVVIDSECLGCPEDTVSSRVYIYMENNYKNLDASN